MIWNWYKIVLILTRDEASSGAPALCLIAMKLNGERVPQQRSRVRAAEMRRWVGVGR